MEFDDLLGLTNGTVLPTESEASQITENIIRVGTNGTFVMVDPDENGEIYLAGWACSDDWAKRAWGWGSVAELDAETPIGQYLHPSSPLLPPDLRLAPAFEWAQATYAHAMQGARYRGSDGLFEATTLRVSQRFSLLYATRDASSLELPCAISIGLEPKG